MKPKHKRLWALWNKEEERSQPVQEIVTPVEEPIPVATPEVVVEEIVETTETVEEPAVEVAKPKTTKKAKA